MRNLNEIIHNYEINKADATAAAVEAAAAGKEGAMICVCTKSHVVPPQRLLFTFFGID